VTLETAEWYHNRRHAPIPQMRMERSKLTDDRLEGDERGSELDQGSDLRMNPRVLLAFRANREQSARHQRP